MKITIGALAHVDAGKTTLSETILYKNNAIKNKGKIENKDTFLDFNDIEKEKGITVYNKQANFVYKDKQYIYLDTPGHNDLAYETSRAINVLDCAILLLSAIEDIPIDTIQKFNYLLQNNIPTLIFVNKMDITNYTKQEILTKIQNKLSSDCIAYEDCFEHLSLYSDQLLDYYLKNNSIEDDVVTKHFMENHFFPVFFGSALKDIGIEEMLEFIYKYVKVDYQNDQELNAYIYKINNEYSFLKILSGTLVNKQQFDKYKINEIYEVSGNTYTPIAQAYASNIVAVKGISQIQIGTYLPSFNTSSIYKLPTLTYRIKADLDANELYKKSSDIINEFPELNIQLENNNIFIQLNGELHATIIKNLFLQRLGIEIDFSLPIIKYKETIKDEVYGVGHFEPLRHYGEVIVNIKPYNSGIKINSLIENNYTNSLISYLRNYTIRGILTNSPLDNVEITIVDIKTHPKHTEGGDLIQSLRRAIRQGLSKIDSILLEPFYLTSIDINTTNTNDIISYLTQNRCDYSLNDTTIISSIRQVNFNSIITGLKSKLKGQLSFTILQTVYDECDNANEIIEARHYDYIQDYKNPAGSVFCKGGAGHYVEPKDVEDNMHLDMSNYVKKQNATTQSHNRIKISDDELKRVINSIYKPKQRYIPKQVKETTYNKQTKLELKPIIYLIDGYNLMYYFDEENAINDMISSRENIINLVCDYAGYVNANMILVFDAYKTDMIKAEVIEQDNITIVYTKQKQTADFYIEAKSKELQDDYKVTVVTSDNFEQLRAFSNNASIISSREFIARYNNLKKNNTKLNKKFSYKPLAKLKQLLIED